MKECPVHACGGLIAGHLLMCHSHWLLLPFEMRSEMLYLNRCASGTSEQQQAHREALDYVNSLNRHARMFA